MKYARFAIFFSLLTHLACQMSTRGGDSLKYFIDCIPNGDSSYCISFSIDSTYERTNNLAGGGWGPTKAYRFTSLNDTVLVRVYIQQFSSNVIQERNIPDEPSYPLKLYNDYGCAISHSKIIKSFLEGPATYCSSTHKDVVEFFGMSQENFNGYMAGVSVVSQGLQQQSRTRHKRFEDLVKSIRINAR